MKRTMTVRAAFENQYRRYRLRCASPSTLLQFRVNLKHFDEYLGHEATLVDLTNEEVAGCMAHLVETGRAVPTANKFRTNILSVWLLLCRRGELKTWPDVDKMREPQRCPRAWTKRELERLFAECLRVRGFVVGVPAAQWWHTLHLAAWDSGERISALLATRWEAVDLPGRWLFVPAESRKGKTADRIYRLHRETVAALRAVREPARELVWPWPLHRSSLWNHYARILRAAGLPFDRKSKFHRIRKSMASHAAAAGLDATALLGHSHPKVTAAYLDERIVTRPHASDVLFRPG